MLGAGSIGLFWAASIRSAFPSYPLAVLFRSHHQSRMGNNAKEITICTLQNGRPRMANVPCQFVGDDALQQKPIRNLILSTKAFQAVDAIESILSRLDPHSLRILVLCNGAMDVRDMLKDTLAPHNLDPTLIMCTTTNGVVQEPPDEDMFHLEHIGQGRTFLGGMPDMAQLWDQSGLNATCIGEDEMEVLLWQKLAANCVCNPLTALWQLTNGELSSQASFQSIRQNVVEEVSKVGRALRPDLKEQLSPMALDAFVEQVIQENQMNKSSMYHDVMKQQRTEVDNLNGYIVRKGDELGIQTPGNRDLLSQIQEITSSYLDSSTN